METEKKELRRVMEYLRVLSRQLQYGDYSSYNDDLISESTAACVGLSVDEAADLRSKFRITLMLDYLLRKVSETNELLCKATIDNESYSEICEKIWRICGAVRDITYIIESDFQFTEEYYGLLHD